MKALYVTGFGDPDVLQWREVPNPEPGAGEVLVKIAATAVNWTDIMEREGRYPGGPQPEFVSGHDFAGELVATGVGVSGHEIGSRVFGLMPRPPGAAADYAVMPAGWVHPTPASVSDEEAAGIASPFFTAEAAVTDMGQLQKGQTVLVQAAAGGLGSAIVQLARLYGAGTIIGTAGTPERCRRVEELGADLCVDYSTEDFVAATREATGGRGADIVFDSVGGEVLGKSFDCVAPLGRIICIGATEGHSTNRFRLHTLFEKDILVGGFTLGNWWSTAPEVVDAVVRRVTAHLASRKAVVLVSKVFAAEQAADAHRYLQARQSLGRTVIALG